MLNVYMIHPKHWGYGCYNEILVAAETPEEAKEILLAQAADSDLSEMYEGFTDEADGMEITNWGPLTKGIIFEAGSD